MRLIFMGTPATAVVSLQRCLADGHEIVSVWTQPEKPAGRGKHLTAPPVKLFAQEHGIEIVQPLRIKTAEAAAEFARHNADAAVVVAYGRILPPAFLQAPKHGCINVHFSLLPKYRGAAPVNWAIANCEGMTGVTTMRMDEGLDTGAILLQEQSSIGPQETAPELMARLALDGAELLSQTLKELNQIEPSVQDHSIATLAPILTREMGFIDWTENAHSIACKVRGFQPWPCAFTTFQQKRLIIWRAEQSTGAGASPGEITVAHGDDLRVASGAGTELRLLEVQPEGKRRMATRDFLNGAHFQAGERCG